MPATSLPYRDRSEAGVVLAELLEPLAGRPDLVVLALPRGGVLVAAEVAEALHAPLDLMLVRKLGLPGHEELALGAIASGGVRVLNPDVVPYASARAVEEVTRKEQAELERRERVYRGDRPPVEVAGHTVILVDDGLATGATMRAAVAALRQRDPAEIIVAVPVAPADTIALLRGEADAVVCPAAPEPFAGIGRWYQDFRQVGDGDVVKALTRAHKAEHASTNHP